MNMKTICLGLMAAVLLYCCRGKGIAPNIQNEKHYEKVKCLNFFGVELKGRDLESIVQRMRKSINVFEFQDKNMEEKDAYVVSLSGIPCGMNFMKRTANDSVYIVQLNFCTSQHSRGVIDTLVHSITDYYGDPDIVEEECLDEGYVDYRWQDAGIKIRNIHSDRGGIVVFYYQTTGNSSMP